MLPHNLKSIRGLRKKMKPCRLVERPKFKFDRPRIALYQHQTAFFYMRERVTHETNLTLQILVQKLFPTFFNT